jgi:hypothetical protein
VRLRCIGGDDVSFIAHDFTVMREMISSVQKGMDGMKSDDDDDDKYL